VLDILVELDLKEVGGHRNVQIDGGRDEVELEIIVAATIGASSRIEVLDFALAGKLRRG
jgi:hypothetical protein